MNAQEQWKEYYRIKCFYLAADVRYAAALERIIARQQREIEALREAARKFSAAHGYDSPEDDPRVDPQDWAEFDIAFGFYVEGTVPA